MGLFDSVMVPCPNCGEEYEAQSKGGKCMLKTYSIDEVPVDVLQDVNRHAPFVCPKCKTKFRVGFFVKVIGYNVVEE